MRNFVILLYFAFLFKLAFAQSIPSMPDFGSDGSSPFDPISEIPEMDDDSPFPADFDIPEMGNNNSGGSQNNDFGDFGNIESGNSEINSAELDSIPDIETPSLGNASQNAEDSFDQLDQQFNSQNIANMEDDIDEPVMQINQFEPKDLSAQEEDINIPTDDFEGVAIENFFAEQSLDSPVSEEEFPDTPELGFRKPDEQIRRNTVEVKEELSPEEKERQVEEVLSTIFTETKPVIPTLDQNQDNNVKDNSEAENLAKMGDFEDDKSNRARHKPITYSEDQLVSHLVKAAIVGNKEAVIALLHSGRDVNSVNKFGETALMGAVYGGHNNIVEILLSEGANPNISDNKGNKPIHVASANSNFFAAQQLVRKGSEIDPRNNSNDTPLLIATLNNALDIVDLLIRNGADVNQANNDGLTALHVATYNNNMEIVKYLLYVGANANMVNRQGLKPYDLAYGNNLQIARLLAAYTGPQRFVSTDLPQIIYNRNQPVTASATNIDQNNRFNIVPDAYNQQQEAAQQVRQPQYQWWGATENAQQNIQEVREEPNMGDQSSYMNNQNTNNFVQNENPNFRQSQNNFVSAQPAIPQQDFNQQAPQEQQYIQSSLQQQIMDLNNNEFEEDLSNYEGNAQAYENVAANNYENSFPTQMPQSMAYNNSNSPTQNNNSYNNNIATNNSSNIYTNPASGNNNNMASNTPRSLNYRDLERKRVNQAQFSNVSYLSSVRKKTQPAQNVIQNNLSFIDPERTRRVTPANAPASMQRRSNSFNSSSYRDSFRTRDLQGYNNPGVQYNSPNTAVANSNYQSPSVKVRPINYGNRISNNRPVNNYSNRLNNNNRQTQRKQPREQLIPDSMANKQPVYNSVTNKKQKAEQRAKPKNKNIKYSEMTIGERYKWDSKLEKWVKASMQLNNMSDKNKQIWQKQKAILEAIYDDRFRSSVARTKQKILISLRQDKKLKKNIGQNLSVY